MVTFQARFDGRVLVPEGPVDLPVGKVLEVRVEVVEKSGAKEGREGGLVFDIHPVTGLPVFRVPRGSRPITSEDVRRAEDEW